MQTPKARPGSLEVPQRKSPVTPRGTRQLKMLGSESDSVSSSQQPASRTSSKDKSPKVIERRSPRSPAAEKKRPSKVSELESQLAQLQEDLKKAKDQLNLSESWKRRAQQEAEEARKQMSAMSAKLEESQQQFFELSASEDDRIQELRKISQDRDRAWQSELEAVQKQHSMDTAALASAMNEIQKLKAQLEMVAGSEATQSKHAESAHAELQGLRVELTKTLSLVEKLKADLTNCRLSEAQALELVSKNQMQLETANATSEMLRSDGIKAMEDYNSLSLEHEQSKAQIKSLEELVSKLQVDLVNSSSKNLVSRTSDVKSEWENEEAKQLKAELNLVENMESYNSLSLELEQSKAQIKSLEELVSKLQIDLVNSSSKNLVAPTSDVKSEWENGENEETKQLKAELNLVEKMEAYNSLSLELEESKAQTKSLEELVSKLQVDLVNSSSKILVAPTSDVKSEWENGENDETKQLKAELNLVKSEVDQLRSALDAAEIKYQEEYIQSTLQIRGAYEQLERIKSESCQMEAGLETELEKAKACIEELRATLMDKETELQSISEENEGLNMKIEKNQSSDRESELAVGLKKSEEDLTDLKASLLDKETKLESITEENKILAMEIKKMEIEKNKINDEAVALAEVARAAEQEALMKLGCATEEADKSSRKAARVSEQLDAAQAANSDLEAELRRLKVQSDQWRKAAETAAAMLSTGNNGKYVERTGSLDSSYNTITGRMDSPYSEDMDDDSPKKKNTNMLKKIGVLWKKGH